MKTSLSKPLCTHLPCFSIALHSRATPTAAIPCPPLRSNSHVACHMAYRWSTNTYSFDFDSTSPCPPRLPSILRYRPTTTPVISPSLSPRLSRLVRGPLVPIYLCSPGLISAWLVTVDATRCCAPSVTRSLHPHSFMFLFLS